MAHTARRTDVGPCLSRRRCKTRQRETERVGGLNATGNILPPTLAGGWLVDDVEGYRDSECPSIPGHRPPKTSRAGLYPQLGEKYRVQRLEISLTEVVSQCLSGMSWTRCKERRSQSNWFGETDFAPGAQNVNGRLPRNAISTPIQMIDRSG